MNGKIGVQIIGFIAAVLLLASFPVKAIYGQGYCDGMRFFGFACLLVWSLLHLRRK